MSSSVIKYARRQDSGWKQAAGCSGETSINLSAEIFKFLSYGLVDSGEECGVLFRIYRVDFIDALTFIKTQLPLYRSSSNSSEKITENHSIFSKLESSIDNFFQDQNHADYQATLYCRRDGRCYLKGLKYQGFSIRDFLVEYSSAIRFVMTPDGFELRVISAISKDEVS